MTPNEYLAKVLSAQTLASNSPELKDLQERRAEVEEHLREHFDGSSPTVRYGGSKAKGTMIKESYDLDIVCYLDHEDTAAGETLEDIYNNVRKALESKYMVEPKTSALRLKNPKKDRLGADFHIDVVPGRFTDDKKSDAFLYQAGGDKNRLKTNIDMHISHVRDSGVIDPIKLLKLWKVRNGINLKTFVLELVIIKLLEDKKKRDLATQLKHVWTEFGDHINNVVVKDPANPEGNDLTPVLDAARSTLQSIAGRTLSLIESSSWEAVFGAVEDAASADKTAGLRRAAAAVVVPSRPWCPHGS